MLLQAQTRPTVLLACTTQSRARLYPILAEIADVVTALTLEDAVQRLADNPALIVCNMKFDDSRMLDLAAEASHRHPHIPFVCCRTSGSELPTASMHAARAAASNLGVVDFLDLFAMTAEVGQQRAAGLFKEHFAQSLAGRRPPPSTGASVNPNAPA